MTEKQGRAKVLYKLRGATMGTINAGDTAWVLIASALVLMMTPALGFFYGGMVRKKNILSTLNLSFVMIALISIQWILYGYSLVFGADHGGLIGGLNFAGFAGVGASPNPAYGQRRSLMRPLHFSK